MRLLLLLTTCLFSTHKIPLLLENAIKFAIFYYLFNTCVWTRTDNMWIKIVNILINTKSINKCRKSVKNKRNKSILIDTIFHAYKIARSIIIIGPIRKTSSMKSDSCCLGRIVDVTSSSATWMDHNSKKNRCKRVRRWIWFRLVIYFRSISNKMSCFMAFKLDFEHTLHRD